MVCDIFCLNHTWDFEFRSFLGLVTLAIALSHNPPKNVQSRRTPAPCCQCAVVLSCDLRQGRCTYCSLHWGHGPMVIGRVPVYTTTEHSPDTQAFSWVFAQSVLTAACPGAEVGFPLPGTETMAQRLLGLQQLSAPWRWRAQQAEPGLGGRGPICTAGFHSNPALNACPMEGSSFLLHKAWLLPQLRGP